MTNEEINRAMAEIAGWKIIETPEELDWPVGCDEAWVNPEGEHICSRCQDNQLPDYASDLNPVREVELKLVEEGLGID